MMRRPAVGIQRGDRAIYQGIATVRRGKFVDVLHADRDISHVVFKDDARMMVETRSLHVVPIRQEPDF